MDSLVLWAVFAFLLGICIGSFLNVVVWRIPRGQSIARPAYSYCPKCGSRIAWYDNIPIIGWIALRGRCRRCGGGISVRYPLVELATGGLFIGLLLGVYAGPLRPDIGSWPGNWPGYVAALAIMSGLLAASLIDLEHFFIPIEITWSAALLTIVLATAFPGGDAGRWLPVAESPAVTAWGVGGTAGLLLSISLLWIGVLPTSFPPKPGEDVAVRPAAPPPAPVGKGKGRKRKSEETSHHRSPSPQIGQTVGARREILKELLFLLPVVLLAAGWAWLTGSTGPFHRAWLLWCDRPQLLGLGGSLFGMLVGGGIVWLVRIMGTGAAGREAMGLGDVHLLAAAGALVGWAGALLAFFLAPFFAIAIGVIQYFRHGRRELPFGPYLSLAVLAVLLFFDRFEAWLAPSLRIIFTGRP